MKFLNSNLQPAGRRAEFFSNQKHVLNILLLANYQNDRQESMLRFAGLLEAELRKAGGRVGGRSAGAVFPWPAQARGATEWAKWLGYIDKFLIFPFALIRKVRRMRGGEFVVHICDHSNAFYTRWLEGTPHLVTCNDLLAIRSARGRVFPGHRDGFHGKIAVPPALDLQAGCCAPCGSRAYRRLRCGICFGFPGSILTRWM